MIININEPETLKKRMMDRGMSAEEEEADAAAERFIRAAKCLFDESFDDNDEKENDEND